MQHVNGVPVYSDDPTLYYSGLEHEPTWFSAQGGVYRCTSRRAPYTEVAIKKYLVEETDLYPDLFVMPKELVENEIYTMTKCVHNNILKLQGVYLHQEFVYLIMPYCTGGSLQQYVFDHHLTIGQLVHIITSIASGLAEIHRHGYIHRDIKCDNIFLMQETNEIVIGDFGVVSISPAADSNVEEAGVVLFWSPELVQRKIVNRKVDIWALGIVILEILNGGKAPYEDDKLDEEEIKQRILENGKPTYPDNLPSRLIDLLDLCLNPDPKSRGSAADVLQHPFLCDYEPEPLFPGNRLDKQDDMSIDDDDNNNDEAMETALNKLRALESLHGMDIGLDQDEQHVTTTTSTTDNRTSKLVEAAAAASDHQQSSRSPSLSPPGSNETSTSSLDTNRTTATTCSTDQKENQPTVVATTTSTMGSKRIPATVSDIRRCRLPLRAFKLTEENANANNTTTKEKVLSVVKKRQSISEIHWAQGSKLPVFKAQPPSILEDIKEKKIKRVKSVRLPKEQVKENKPVRKPLVRANTMPASQSSNLLLKKQQQQKPASAPKKMTSQQQNNNKPTSPVSSSKSIARPKVMFSPPPPPDSSNKERPKKKVSIYRRKCLPGESRTARLMMGISTTGRVRSPRETSPTENMPPTSSSRSFLRDSIKKRPVSFADKQPDAKKIHPEATQTTPLPVATKSKRFPFGKKPSSSSSANKGPQQPTKSTAATSSFKGIKTVRVH